jgi:hypothetical protein
LLHRAIAAVIRRLVSAAWVSKSWWSKEGARLFR